jgi:hypothetical protein
VPGLEQLLTAESPGLTGGEQHACDQDETAARRRSRQSRIG